MRSLCNIYRVIKTVYCLSNSFREMDKMSTKTSKNKRKIRYLEDHNLNRSSLASGTSFKQNSINGKHEALKFQTRDLDYLPKVHLKTNKENHVNRTKIHSVQDNVTNIKVHDFIISKLEDVIYPSSSQVEESPDEIVFKSRSKKNNNSGSVNKVQLNKRENSEHLRRQSVSPSTVESENTSLQYDLLMKSAENRLKPQEILLQQKNENTISKITNCRRQTRKSVRFLTPSPENKRNTFELEVSSFDKSLLPNIPENEFTKHCTYKKSPHIKKFQTCIDNTFTDQESNCESIAIETSNILDQSDWKVSVIDLITPNSTKMHTIVSNGKKKNKKILNMTSNSSNDNSLMVCNEKIKNARNKSSTTTVDNTLSKVDSSTPNKRKTWNKSMDCSFLDDINNVSAPWTNGTFRLSVSEEHLGNQETTFDENKCRIQPVIPGNFVKKVCLTNTSTPLYHQKKLLMKEKPKVTEGESQCTKFTRKIKMPDFARIHQRAYDKLENIKEMSERKAARAHLLLSGHKPDSALSLQYKSPKSKKELRYSPKPNLQENMHTSKVKINNKVQSGPSTLNFKSKTLPRPVANKIEGTNLKSRIPKPVINKKLNDKNGISRFGFKIKDVVKSTSKGEQINAVVQKSRVINDPVDKRRNLVKNVRSNRRFELLMQMRKK